MTVATILTAFTLAAGLQANETVQTPEGAALRVEIEDTHFKAQSLAETPLLIVFASEDDQLKTAFWLPAGGCYDEEFPRGTLIGLELEVAHQTQGGWITSKALTLDPEAPTGAQLMWVLDCGHAVTQEGEGEPLSALTPDGSVLPPQLNIVAGDHEAHAAFHVPVDTPEDKPKGDKPPRLRKKPLPPV